MGGIGTKRKLSSPSIPPHERKRLCLSELTDQNLSQIESGFDGCKSENSLNFWAFVFGLAHFLQVLSNSSLKDDFPAIKPIEIKRIASVIVEERGERVIRDLIGKKDWQAFLDMRKCHVCFVS
jgi:hypothetical protein